MILKQLHNKKITAVITYLMIVLFALQVANRAVYVHNHILANGQIISHAHPYNKTDDPGPFKHHQHTQSEIIYLENQQLLFPFIFLLLALLFLTRKEYHTEHIASEYVPELINLQKGRSPPLS